MNMQKDRELEQLIIGIGNKRIRIKELEELRKALAKEFDEKQHLVSPLSAHLISYEKSTETFITNIMGRLVRVQNELTLTREQLLKDEERIEQLRENYIEDDEQEI